MTEQAGMWVRVSTADQTEASQAPDVERWCASHGYEITRRYELNDRSAFHGEQDAKLAEMLADLEAGRIKVLVIWHSDRLERRGGRELINLIARIHELGGRIESTQEPTLGQQDMGGQIMTFISGINAYEESHHKSQRVGIAFATIKANGGVIGRAGYGYRVVGETKYEKHFVPDTVEAAVIREAATRYLDGETIDAICADFNARHIPSPMWKGRPGKHWYARTLAGLLRSPSIAGRRYPRDSHNLPDTTRPPIATYEPIISWDEHKRLVARLDSRAHRKGISPGNVALLTSLLFDANDHPMYRLNTFYYCRKCKASANLAKMDAQVNDLFSRSQEPYAIQQVVPGDNNDDLISRLRVDRSELDDLSSDYDQRHAELTAEIRRLAALPAEPDRIEWVPTGQTYGEVWEGMTTAERRDMMLEAGFRFIWHGEGRWEAVVPEGWLTVADNGR